MKRVIRPLVLLLVLGTIAFFVWRHANRREGYAGGDVETTGTVEAVHLDLSFQVGGRLAIVPVSEGNDVIPGQLVARIETQDLEVAVRAARAALEVAKATQNQTRTTREKADRDLVRMTALYQSGVTSQQQMDAVKVAADVAATQVEQSLAQLHQAEVALAKAELDLSYSELRAPEAGRIAEKIHRPGEMVMIGTPVVSLARMDTVKVLAAVDETRVGAVRPGDSVTVRVYTFDQRTFPGVVTDIQPSGDFATRKDWGAQRRDIRTFTVTAAVPNPELLLKDGMTADVTIHPSLQGQGGPRP